MGLGNLTFREPPRMESPRKPCINEFKLCNSKQHINSPPHECKQPKPFHIPRFHTINPWSFLILCIVALHSIFGCPPTYSHSMATSHTMFGISTHPHLTLSWHSKRARHFGNVIHNAYVHLKARGLGFASRIQRRLRSLREINKRGFRG